MGGASSAPLLKRTLSSSSFQSILADGWEGDGGRLELPDFTLQLAEDVLLHVQYASTSTRGFECSINAATVDREYTASLSAELARLRIEVDADPGASGSLPPPHPTNPFRCRRFTLSRL